MQCHSENIHYLEDPLPIQIVLWVSIQLYGSIIINPNSPDFYWIENKKKLYGYIQSLKNIVDKNLIKVWSMILDQFNANSLEQFINRDKVSANDHVTVKKENRLPFKMH